MPLICPPPISATLAASVGRPAFFSRSGAHLYGPSAADITTVCATPPPGGPGREDDGDRAGGYDTDHTGAGHAKAEPQPPPVVVVQLNRGIPPSATAQSCHIARLCAAPAAMRIPAPQTVPDARRPERGWRAD